MKNEKKVLLTTAILVIAFILGCAATSQVLSRVSLGMTKAGVRNQIGEPTAVRGAIINKYGQCIDVWEYRLYRYSGAIEGLSPYFDLYWLYFVDDKLVQWGQAGDWQKEADRIYDIRFR